MARTSSLLGRVARLVVACTLATALLSGCYHVKYGTNDATGIEHSKWSHFFFFGLIGKEELAVSDFCPNGAARIHTYMSFVNGLVTIFPGLFGLIWTPRTVEITCKGGGRAVLELDGEGLAQRIEVTAPNGESRRLELEQPLAYRGPESIDAQAREQEGQP